MAARHEHYQREWREIQQKVTQGRVSYPSIQDTQSRSTQESEQATLRTDTQSQILQKNDDYE